MSPMTLEEIKREVQDAAQELHNADAYAAVNRLVDAFLLLTQYLEERQHSDNK